MNIAVTGLNATDNPGPGVPVIRSLKESPGFQGRFIGLVYDTLEPGVYMDHVADRYYVMPYPSSGLDAVLDRLRYIHSQEKLDLILPTLDTEQYVFCRLHDELKSMGIATLTPTVEQLNLRGKDKLQSFCTANGILAPETRLVNSAHDLQALSPSLSYPVMIKGVFYDAQAANSYDEAVGAFHRIRHKWGLPIIVQEQVIGDEFNVVALGDGTGNTVGAVAMRKTYVTDKGKGWAGVTVLDPALLSLARSVIEKLQWSGGLELEFIKSKRSGEFCLLEINPRFPAWTYLATAAGQNLPAAWMALAQGQAPKNFDTYEVGKMFVRCSWDLIADIGRMEELLTSGEVQ